jgi:hypothetical protein
MALQSGFAFAATVCPLFSEKKEQHMRQLQLRAMAVAAALIAAGPATAAILDSTATVTGGELFLSVYDAARQISYTRDLGITLTNFLPAGTTAPTAGSIPFNPAAAPSVGAGNVLTPGYTLTFANDPVLLSAFGGNLSGATYQVLAEKGGFSYAYLTTTSADLATVSTSTTSQVSNFRAGADPYLAAVNLEGTHATGLNGSSFTIDPNDAANVGKILQTNWGGKTPIFDTSAAVGSPLDFYLLSRPASGSFVNVSPFTDATWNLNANGVLTYSVAAVPEPSSWVLLAAGLVAVAGIARRRTQG